MNCQAGTVSCTVVWLNGSSIDHCNIYYSTDDTVHHRLLGRAYCERFCVVKLSTDGHTSVTLHVQPVTRDRQTCSVQNSPSVAVTV